MLWPPRDPIHNCQSGALSDASTNPVLPNINHSSPVLAARNRANHAKRAEEHTALLALGPSRSTAPKSTTTPVHSLGARGGAARGAEAVRFDSQSKAEVQRKLLALPRFEQSPPSHSRAYDREHGRVNSSMDFEWLGALSTCLCVYLHLSASRSRELKLGPVNKSRAPSKKKPDGGFNEVAFSQPKATQKHHPFQASGHTQNTNAPT